MRYHTQTTDSLLDKFNGREGKQHMAVCRISFVCFVNKFPPESALTPPLPAARPRTESCQNAHFLSEYFQFVLENGCTGTILFERCYDCTYNLQCVVHYKTVLLLQVILYISVTIMSRKDPQKEIYQRKRVTEEQATLWNILVSELKLC